MCQIRVSTRIWVWVREERSSSSRAPSSTLHLRGITKHFFFLLFWIIDENKLSTKGSTSLRVYLNFNRKSFGEPSYQSVQLVVLPSNHSHLFVSTNSVSEQFQIRNLQISLILQKHKLIRLNSNRLISCYFKGRIIHVTKNTRKVVPAFYKTPLGLLSNSYFWKISRLVF